MAQLSKVPFFNLYLLFIRILLMIFILKKYSLKKNIVFSNSNILKNVFFY